MNASRYIIKGQDYENVINQFMTQHDNRTSVIAKTLNLHFNYVNYIIYYHLSMKKTYTGVVPVVKNCQNST